LRAAVLHDYANAIQSEPPSSELQALHTVNLAQSAMDAIFSPQALMLSLAEGAPLPGECSKYAVRTARYFRTNRIVDKLLQALMLSLTEGAPLLTKAHICWKNIIAKEQGVQHLRISCFRR